MADGDGAMVQVDAGIHCLEGAVGRITLLVAAYNVVAHPQGNDLFVVEDVLNDDDGTATLFIGLLVGMVILLTVVELAHTDADAELLAAIRTFEYQRLACFILGLIKDDVLVAFRTSYSFHT